jgi:hypothetical protein
MSGNKSTQILHPLALSTQIGIQANLRAEDYACRLIRSADSDILCPRGLRTASF